MSASFCNDVCMLQTMLHQNQSLNVVDDAPFCAAAPMKLETITASDLRLAPELKG